MFCHASYKVRCMMHHLLPCTYCGTSLVNRGESFLKSTITCFNISVIVLNIFHIKRWGRRDVFHPLTISKHSRRVPLLSAATEYVWQMKRSFMWGHIIVARRPELPYSLLLRHGGRGGAGNTGTAVLILIGGAMSWQGDLICRLGT